MFERDKDRYLTRGVDAEIPLVLQVFLWECIDRMPEERDYLQVFSFSDMTEKILMSAKQFYDECYKYDAKIFPICISIYYNTDDVERDLKLYMDEWYYQVPEGQMSIVDKGIDLDDHIKQAWDSLLKAQFKPLGHRTPEGCTLPICSVHRSPAENICW